MTVSRGATGRGAKVEGSKSSRGGRVHCAVRGGHGSDMGRNRGLVLGEKEKNMDWFLILLLVTIVRCLNVTKGGNS